MTFARLAGGIGAKVTAPNPGGTDDVRRGALLESFVVNEIASQLEWEGGADGYYHWRDRNRHEVDLVVELSDRFVAIEIRQTREVPRKAAAGIDAFQPRSAGGPTRSSVPWIVLAVVAHEVRHAARWAGPARVDRLPIVGEHVDLVATSTAPVAVTP